MAAEKNIQLSNQAGQFLYLICTNVKANDRGRIRKMNLAFKSLKDPVMAYENRRAEIIASGKDANLKLEAEMTKPLKEFTDDKGKKTPARDAALVTKLETELGVKDGMLTELADKKAAFTFDSNVFAFIAGEIETVIQAGFKWGNGAEAMKGRRDIELADEVLTVFIAEEK